MRNREVTREEIMGRLAAGETQRAIAKSFGVSYQSIQRWRRVWGEPLLKPAPHTGAAHPSWRGGRTLDERTGYIRISSPNAPSGNRYQYEHIVVAERMAGRRLQPGEVVHHVNGIKTDNREENLLICTRSHHRVLHGQLEAIGYTLIERGLVAFRDGAYVLTE